MYTASRRAGLWAASPNASCNLRGCQCLSYEVVLLVPEQHRTPIAQQLLCSIAQRTNNFGGGSLLVHQADRFTSIDEGDLVVFLTHGLRELLASTCISRQFTCPRRPLLGEAIVQRASRITRWPGKLLRDIKGRGQDRLRLLRLEDTRARLLCTLAFGRSEQAGAHPDTLGPGGQRRRHTTRRRDAARRDGRNLHRVKHKL